ncbi:MAG: META domain-containing protein [Burkholderiaceae bacterium]|nr:META domain-containing protein [Burkholderiaceae bacterium]
MKPYLVGSLVMAMLAGCAGTMEAGAPAGSSEKKMAPDMHTSQNSLDWAGAYEGVLPCADCPGIKTRLTLKPDGRYELSTQYLDRQPAPTVETGKFFWNTRGNGITLESSGQRFAVGEGRLLALYRDAPTDWSRSPNQVLKQVSGTVPAPTAAAALLQTLEDHRWTLASAADARGQRIGALVPNATRPFVLSFSGSRLQAQGGCNQLTGVFQLSPEGVLSVGRMASTMMACEAPLMQADKALSDLLAKGMKVELSKGTPPMLRLIDPSKASLTLTGQATAEALYGPATRMFMEVAAQRVACKNPLNGETLCLQVRERNFDEKGLLVGVPGEWRPLYESIEGYQHTPGVRNVLRLKKFQRPALQTGTPATVYVLDLVVESATVKP